VSFDLILSACVAESKVMPVIILHNYFFGVVRFFTKVRDNFSQIRLLCKFDFHSKNGIMLSKIINNPKSEYFSYNQYFYKRVSLTLKDRGIDFNESNA